MESLKVMLPQTTTTEELLDEIDKLNGQPAGKWHITPASGAATDQ